MRIAPTDQAFIEQKNGAVIRRFAGYERFAGFIAGQTLARLFALVGLYTNFFQPSFKLISKQRYGARTQKRYDRPLTPCQRLLDHPAVAIKVKAGLRDKRSKLDPLRFLLSNEIRAAINRPQWWPPWHQPEERSKVQKDDLISNSWPFSLSHCVARRSISKSRVGAPSVNAVSGGGPLPDPLESCFNGPRCLPTCRIIPTPAGCRS